MISEDLIMRHLDLLTTGSDPGDSLHHLNVVSAPVSAIGPLGMVADEDLHSTVYAIAADRQAEPVQQFVGRVIKMAGLEAVRERRLPVFAALAQEVWMVDPMDDEAHRLLREGRMLEHPRAAEVTMIYAACRDGRRWRARHWLTGPRAGTLQDVDLLVGEPSRYEGQVPGTDLLRVLVGLAR